MVAIHAVTFLEVADDRLDERDCDLTKSDNRDHRVSLAGGVGAEAAAVANIGDNAGQRRPLPP